MYFSPRVVYSDPHEDRKNSIIRYIKNRVLRNNKNFLCALTGMTGSGKSWSGCSLCEIYSAATGIPFDPEQHIIFSLKQLLELITSKEIDKKIRFGTALLFDEPQIEANAREWQSEANNILNQLISTFRNQRLVVFFATPYLEFIDKQSRILFHGDFNVQGFDKNTKLTTLAPRFLEFNKRRQDFYRKRLIITYAVEGKEVYDTVKLNKWEIPAPSEKVIEIYERKKKEFTDDLNAKLLAKLAKKDMKPMIATRNEDIIKIKEIMERTGGNFMEIVKEMPHLTPYAIDKFMQLVRRGAKGQYLPKVAA